MQERVIGRSMDVGWFVLRRIDMVRAHELGIVQQGVGAYLPGWGILHYRLCCSSLVIGLIRIQCLIDCDAVAPPEECETQGSALAVAQDVVPVPVDVGDCG